MDYSPTISIITFLPPDMTIMRAYIQLHLPTLPAPDHLTPFGWNYDTHGGKFTLHKCHNIDSDDASTFQEYLLNIQTTQEGELGTHSKAKKRETDARLVLRRCATEK